MHHAAPLRSLRRRPQLLKSIACATSIVIAVGIGPALARKAKGQAADTPPTGKATATLGPGRPVTIPEAEQFDVRAKSGLEYRIFLAAPKGPAPSAGYPAVYLTDGNGNFPVLLAAVEKQSREGLQAVVVGIGYPTDDPLVHRERRAFDLTPRTSEEWQKSSARGMESLKTGGDREFLDFIELELKPAVEARCKIDRTRQTLFGHSFGGLFTLHVLFTRPDAFQTYVAASPSLWWNDGSASAEAKEFLERRTGEKVAARVLITVGEREQRPAPGESKERSQVLEQRRMAGSPKDLVARLNAGGIQGLTAEFREFPEEEHGSVVLPAASRGVRFAFEDKPRSGPSAGPLNTAGEKTGQTDGKETVSPRSRTPTAAPGTKP
jgi:uncharacterized protein